VPGGYKNVKIKDAVVNEPIILINILNILTPVSVFKLLLNRLNVLRIMKTPEIDIDL